jgi:hypothetical protein
MNQQALAGGEFATGGQLVESFQYLHHLRRDPRLSDKQRSAVEERYKALQTGLIGLSAASNAPQKVRDSARSIVYAADADDQADLYAPSLLGYDRAADQRALPRREAFIKEQGLEKQIDSEARDILVKRAGRSANLGGIGTGGMTYEQARLEAIDKFFTNTIGPDIENAKKAGVAFTAPTGTFLGFGKPSPEIRKPKPSDELARFPIGQDVYDGLEAVQVLNRENKIEKDKAGQFITITDPRTGEPKRVDIPSSLASIGPEQGRSFAEALGGLDPYSLDYARLALATDVSGNIIKGAGNIGSKIPVVGTALHAVGLDYKKGEDYDVDSLLGVMAAVPKITGDKARDRELLRNPVALRMLSERDEKRTFLSSVLGGAAGVADFVTTQLALTKVIGVTAKAARIGGNMLARAPLGPGKIGSVYARWGGDIGGRLAAIQSSVPAMVRGGALSGLNFGTARNLAQEVAYGGIAGILNSRSTFWDGVGNGAHEWAIESILSPVGRRLWTGIGKASPAQLIGSAGIKVAELLPSIRKLDLRFESPAVAERLLRMDATRGGIVLDDVRRAGGSLPSSNVELRKMLASRYASAEVSQEILSALDIMFVGAAAHAHFAALEKDEEGSRGYMQAFVDELSSTDALAAGMGMVVGGLGSSGVSRVLGAQRGVRRETATGNIEVMSSDEAINQASFYLWEQMTSPYARPDQLRFMQLVGAQVAKEIANNPSAGRRSTSSNLYKITSADRADGMDSDLKSYMEAKGIDQPWKIDYGAFLDDRRNQGKVNTTGGRPVELGAGNYVSWLNDLAGVSRKDPNYLFSAGERLALLYGQAGRPGSRSLGSTTQAIKNAKTFELQGLAQDLMRLPQRVTDLLPGEIGATGRQVSRTLGRVMRELERRLQPPTGPPPGAPARPGSPPPSPPASRPPAPTVPYIAPGSPPLVAPVTSIPAGSPPVNFVRAKSTNGQSQWINIPELREAWMANPPAFTVASVMERFGVPVHEATRIVVATAEFELDRQMGIRSGPEEPGSPEALRGLLIDRADEAETPSGVPPEFEEGADRAIARLGEPGFLEAEDLEAEAAQDAAQILRGSRVGAVDRAAVLNEADPLIEQLEAGDSTNLSQAQGMLETLRSVQVQLEEEIAETSSEAVDPAALNELVTLQEQVAESLEALTLAVDSIPAAQEAQSEGEMIVAALETIRQAEAIGAAARTAEERLAPEVGALGLTHDEARSRAFDGTLEAPEWFRRLLRGDEPVLTQEEAIAEGRRLLEPFINRPGWMLDPQGFAAKTLNRFVGRPESLSPSLMAAAVEAAKAEALSRQLALPFGGEVTDAAMREDLADEALEATIQGDEVLAQELHRSASLAEEIPDADPVSRIEQTPETPDAVNYQGDLFTPGNDEEAASFDLGQRLMGSSTGDDVSGWRSVVGVWFASGGLPPSVLEARRTAIVNGSIYASGGTAASLSFVDAIFGHRPGSSAERWKSLAQLGAQRNGDAIAAALQRVKDLTGAEIDFGKLPPLARESLSVVSLGARLLSPVSGETRLDVEGLKATIGSVLFEGNPSRAQQLDRARLIVTKGFEGVRRQKSGSASIGSTARTGALLPPGSTDAQIDQMAQGVLEMLERVGKLVTGRASKIKQITPLGRIFEWAKGRAGGVGASPTLGGLTPVQFAAEVIEQVSGSTSGVTGQRSNRADLAASDTIDRAKADARDIYQSASTLGAELEGAVRDGDIDAARTAFRAILATTKSSRALSLDVAETLGRIKGEDGLPLIMDATDDDALLRFWLRAMASPGSNQHRRLIDLAQRSGVSPEDLSSQVRKAQEVLHNQHVLLRFIFDAESRFSSTQKVDEDSFIEGDPLTNAAGDDFYSAFVRVLERAASGVEVSSVEEMELFNHWEPYLGVRLVDEVGGVTQLNEHGVRTAQMIVQGKVRDFSERFGEELEGEDADAAYFFAGPDWKMLTALLPKRLRDEVNLLSSSESIRGGIEGAIIALDSMGLGRLVDFSRIPTEILGRRTKAIGKGSNERKQDVAGVVTSQAAKLRAENFVVETAHAMDDYWSSIPAHMREAAGVLIDTGAWQSIRNAKHLASILNEPLTPKVSQLYDAMLDYNYRILEIGRQAVLSGFISRDQFNSFTSGKVNLGQAVPTTTPARTSYLMAALAPTPNGHLHNQSVNPGSRSSREGIFATVGREMARNWAGVADNAARIFDPLVGLSRSVAQESNQVAIYSYLQKMGTKWGVPFDELGKRIPRHERRAFMVAAVPLGFTGDRDPVSGRRILPVQRALASWVGEIRAGEAAWRASNGTEGIRPNLMRTRTLEALVPSDGSPGVSITRHNSFDLKFMLEQYAEGGDFGSAVGQILDGFYARWRRTRTTSRLSHIIMSQASAYVSNVALRRTTWLDIARGLLTNSGPYADAAEAQSAMANHIEDPNGGHDKHPLFQDYRQFLEVAGTTTMVSNLVNNHQAFDVTDRLSRIAGVPLNAGPGVSGHIANALARTTALSLSTADGIERAIARLLAKNPSESEALVRTQELHNAHYAAAEMFHKYAAWRSAARRNPSMAATQEGRLVLYKDAATGTVDYSEVSPHIRQWGSRMRRSPIDSEFSEGSKLLENTGHILHRAVMAVPFLSYTNVMMPTFGRAMISGHGLGALSVITAGAGISAIMIAIARGLGASEEDDDRLAQASEGDEVVSGGGVDEGDLRPVAPAEWRPGSDVVRGYGR